MKPIIPALALALAAPAAYAQSVASLSPAPRMQFFDNSGRPLAGGCVFSYQAGSTTPLATYSNAAGSPNSNPVILDASGRANIWLAPQAYRIDVRAKTTGCLTQGALISSTDQIIDQGFSLARSLAAGTLAIGLTPTPATGSGGGVGSGNALLSATTAGLYVSVNGGAPVQLNGGGGGSGGGTPAGPVNAIQYNTGAGFGGSANLGWNNAGGVLSICAPPATGCTNTSGIQSPAFSSSATGTNPAFVAGGGAGVIQANGDALFQTLTANTVFNSKSEGNTAAIQQFEGRFVINGDGNGYFQGLCVAGNAASETCNYGLNAAGVLTVASCIGCGGGGAGGAAGPTNSVQYNTGTGLGGSTNFTWNNTGFVLSICPPPATGCSNNSGVQSPAFSSTITGATPAYVAGGGAGVIYGNGDATFQTVKATTAFNSLSIGATAAYTQQSQQFQINGDGKAYFQYLCTKGNPNTETCTYGLDQAGVLTVSSCTGCGGSGSGSAAGPATSIQFNTGTGFGGSANLVWSNTGDVLTICPAPATGCTNTSGIQAPAFSSSATGTNPSYVAGNGAAQINGDGKAFFQSLCTSGSAASENCTYGLTGAGVLTVASCVGCGGVTSFNGRTGAVTLTKQDVTNVEGQGLGTGDAVTFNSIGVGGGLYGLAANGVLTVASCSGCSGGAVTSFNGRTGAVSLTKQDVTNVEGQGLGPGDAVTFSSAGASSSFYGPYFNCNRSPADNSDCFLQQNSTFHITGTGYYYGQGLSVTNGIQGSGITAQSQGATIQNNQINYGIHEQDTGGGCNIGTAYAGGIGCASDARLKTSVRDIPNALAGILALKPVAFEWKNNHEPGLGFIAQDVQKQFPDLVKREKDGYLSLSYMGLIPELVKAMQQLTARVALLEARK